MKLNGNIYELCYNKTRRWEIMALDFKPENIWHFVVGLLIILFAAALISVNLSIIREGVLVGLNLIYFKHFTQRILLLP